MEIQQLVNRIRHDVLNMTYQSGANGGHLGGAFSSAEIFAVLYGKIMKVSPEKPLNQDRDCFILSKGHCAIAHYAVLRETGFISEEEMMSFETSESDFSTHEIINPEKGIEISSGSLGYGLSIGIGCALDAKINNKSRKVYVLMGDGECNEGTVWEAAMAASRYNLSNLVGIIDMNNQSLDGYISEIMPVYDMKQVWEGFGWSVQEVDGNNTEELINAFQSLSREKPNIILAHTLKCKGISLAEGKVGWHHVRLTKEQYDAFEKELEKAI